MSHRQLFVVVAASACLGGFVANSATFAAEPSPHATVALESGGKLRAEIHPATSAKGETVILEAPGLLIELPKEAVDEATPADAVQVEYASLAAKVADAAPDHFALAAWCKEKKLDPEREYHLERTIAFDPNHEEARKALGYNLVDGRWIHPEQSMIDAGYVRYKGTWRSQMELERILAAEKTEAIRSGYLRDMLNWKRQALRGGPQATEAILNFQRVTDPLALYALQKLVTDEKEVEAMRRVYVDVIGRIPGGEANSLLAHVAMNDPFGSVRETAIDRLVQRQANGVVPMLISQLYGENNVLTNRAAVVIGRLRDRRAVSALIDVLVTEQKQTITIGSPGGIGTTFGGGPGNSIGGLSAGGSTQTVTRQVQNPEVLAALNSITEMGQRFGYDQDLWSRWYSDARNVRNINLRGLPR